MVDKDTGRDSSNPRSPNEIRWDKYVDDWQQTIARVYKQPLEQDNLADLPFRNALQKGGVLEYPGDEWGAGLRTNWENMFRDLFPIDDLVNWKYAVEIGAGGGKYTDLVFELNPTINIVCLDVSSKFLEILRTRFAQKIDHQIFTYHIDTTHPFPVEDAYSRLNWPKLDAVFSIDAMVHVDLQYLMSYLISAARCLSEGGYLIMTLADCTTAAGFEKLVRETPSSFRAQGSPTAKFEWLSPQAVQFIAQQLGFEIVKLESPARDMHLVARLKSYNPAVDKLLGVSKQSTAAPLENNTPLQKLSIASVGDIYTTPASLLVSEELLNLSLSPLMPEDITQLNSIDIKTEQWSVNNRFDKPWSVLLQTRPLVLRKGTLFVFNGELRAGTFRVRIVHAKDWQRDHNIFINRLGNFTGVMEIPTDDHYVLQFTTVRDPVIDFSINAAGWINSTKEI